MEILYIILMIIAFLVLLVFIRIRNESLNNVTTKQEGNNKDRSKNKAKDFSKKDLGENWKKSNSKHFGNKDNDYRNIIHKYESKLWDALSKIENLETELEELKNKHSNKPIEKSDKVSQIKRSFIKLYHPDNYEGSKMEQIIREEFFKEFWEEIKKIEKS